MKTRSVHVLLVCLMLGVVGCDHATKGIAEHGLEKGEPVEIVAGSVDLRYSQNHGVAFNTERWVPESVRGPLVVVGGLAAMIFLGVAWIRQYRSPSLQHVGYAIILGGALGNFLDRAIRGYVVDFVHVHGWPVFNVADVAIGAGAALLLLHAFRARSVESRTG